MASPSTHTDALDAKPILSFLGLPNDYSPSPADAPIEFLNQHLFQLPPDILRRFSAVTTPRQRTVIAHVRNRRFKYAHSDPLELQFVSARREWPELWEGRERRGQEEGREEKEWVEKEFLGGSVRSHVGKLGALLGDYEEEREGERVRMARREQVMHEEFVPEEDESSDEDEEPVPDAAEPESTEEAQTLFQRRIRERFIYGQLQTDLYDRVDWDDSLDGNGQDAEERWFDDEEEG
ncbi:hypothetical protein DENSPDRAFT_52567 [Dentipellis sp. KUC8613]|nr:hypothetical protein DENSPDRAFT_52567 [Dentipellis sp. KUC8613]